MENGKKNSGTLLTGKTVRTTRRTDISAYRIRCKVVCSRLVTIEEYGNFIRIWPDDLIPTLIVEIWYGNVNEIGALNFIVSGSQNFADPADRQLFLSYHIHFPSEVFIMYIVP